MFLPVLLVRDFGVAGFLVFAVPNIVGAAAMGTLLPDAESSRRFVDRHRTACAAFSAVTIVFHLFFLQWVIYGLIGPLAYLVFAAALAVLLLLFTAERPAILAAWSVLTLSLLLFAFVAIHAPRATSQIHFLGAQPSLNLLGLAPVCIVGFLLNPYLDLTFHRARQATSPRGGRLAFAVGFGGCFAAMLLFTLWYAQMLDPEVWNTIPRIVAAAIAIHMLVQSAFTIAAHHRSLAMQQWSDAPRTGVIIGGLAAIAPLIFWHLFGPDQESSERVYRLFMGFYGLIFPAYLWICMSGVTRRSITVFAIAVLAAAPMFWLGFIDEKMLWLIPGVALLLLARLFTSAAPLRAAQTAAPILSQHAETTDAR
jgi:hypothetical protein